MTKEGYVLGIDTSNYKTSVALIAKDKTIIADTRKFLEVKPGMRGLRQSEAFFQHIRNLPDMFDQISKLNLPLDGIAYSESPRPVDGSYMPCFMAGASFAKSIAAFLHVPVLAFSHQEGHIEAVRAYSEISDKDPYIACHFSGGTCEVLTVKATCDKSADFAEPGFCDCRNLFFTLEQIGGSKDISFGQVLDRAGVLMGMSFPAGEEMDKLALAASDSTSVLTPIKVKDIQLNLSGIDTQIKNKYSSVDDNSGFILEIFEKISDAIFKLLKQASKASGINTILMSGGVSSSLYIRNSLSERFKSEGINVLFDEKSLSSDNAVGTALLGGRFIWD